MSPSPKKGTVGERFLTRGEKNGQEGMKGLNLFRDLKEHYFL
jgi:hypothetical protein